MFALTVSVAYAHVVVKPSEVGIGKFQTFTIGVPVEKEVATIGIRLVIPEGLKYVTPNVKPGWTITEKKSGGGESAMVTEINWTGGNIPAGQRDDFIFSAQARANETTLQWKAYQTYADGSVVSWDAAPTEEESDKGPYSETKVVNDLLVHQPTDHNFILSISALALAALSLALQLKKKS